MELFYYFRFLKRYFWWLLGAFLVGALIGGGYAYAQKDAYKATMSLFVQRQPDASAHSTQYYTYDGFYAQQTAVAYTDSALKLLTSDEIISRAAKSANLPSDAKSVQELRGTITTKKEAPQVISLSVAMGNQQEASDFAMGLANALKQRTTELNQGGDQKLSVDPVNTSPFVVLVRPLLWLYALVVGGVILLLAIVATAVWDYGRSHNKSRKT